MRYLLFVLLLFSTVVTAQINDKELKENIVKLDSSTARLNASMKEHTRVRDSLDMVEFNRQNELNLNSFMAARKEQERKDMQRMYWRLGFGILMFAILIIGMRRRKKLAAKIK